jgi:protein phosphatase
MARRHNEDCFEIDRDHHLFVVADGMGGHSYGEVASRIAVDTIRDFIADAGDEGPEPESGNPSELSEHSHQLRTAVKTAHQQVLQAILQNHALQGMGTTVVGMYVEGQTAALAHVGDSRAYRYRGGDLELLTEDHTWVNEQVMAGYLSPEQARVHPLKNVVTRALGSEKEVHVDVQEVELEPGDRYLVCSDGLTTMLDESDILEILDSDLPLDQGCQRLVDTANERGGLDNITVILIAVDEDEEESKEA